MLSLPQVDMVGKVAVVTGATGGIGREVARALARLGAHLVIAARDPNRGDATAVQITREGAAGDISAMLLDVADIESVRDFAMAFDRRFDRLDVLVNNAGAWFSDRRESPDGCELTFATNVLGPYLLTQLLADPLISSPNGQIVNVVSSIGGHYDASDLQFERRRFDGYKAYAQSKQALCMLTWGQATRFAGTGVTVNAAEPGFVRSDFNRHARGLRAAAIGLSARFFAVTPAKGADTLVWSSVAPELRAVTGKRFAERKEKEGKFREPDLIADLERRCELFAADGARRRHAKAPTHPADHKAGGGTP